MRKGATFYIVLTLIGLSVIGLFSSLVSDPVSFIKSIIFTAILIGFFYFIAKRIFSINRSNNETRAYNKAVKQSKKRHGKKKTEPIISTKLNRPVKKRKNHGNFTVIEGKKGNKKNRA